MKLHILIVDDSAAIRKILVRVLSQTGLPIETVQEAKDGIEALSLMRKKDFSLVLSDIEMPNMDGLQFITSLRSNPDWKRLSVIMITTVASHTKVLEAVQLGANGYVRKPFTPDQIREKILGCLKSAMN